jgi:hypothetical protein
MSKNLQLLFYILLSCEIAIAEEPYSFSGINKNTTVEELKLRYPNTNFRHASHYKLSNQDRHDHIYSISFQSYRTLVRFEDKDSTGKLIRPLCRTVFDKIYSKFKGPHIVRKFHEVRTPMHTRVWKRDNESMSLSCFELSEGKRYVERVTFY